MVKKLVITGQELGHCPVLLLMLTVSFSVVNGGSKRVDWLFGRGEKITWENSRHPYPGK